MILADGINPTRYFIDDIESGLYEVSKEEYEAHEKATARFKEMFPIKKLKGVGTVVVFGTGGEVKGQDKFKEFWREHKPK